MKLKDRVVLVTGAGRGIGYAVARYCLDQGASVMLAEKNPDRLDKAISSLSFYAEKVKGIAETVATLQGSKRIAEETLSRFGRMDALVNNASITRDNSLLRMTEEEWDQVIENNLKGPYLCTQAVLPAMREQGGGRIINMIAASGVAGNPGQTNYAAAKGGLMAMTLTWSAELKRNNIMVNAVIPAAWTEMSEKIPKDLFIKIVGGEFYHTLRSRKPEQVAPLIGFLSSEAANGITGQCFGIAGRQLTVWDYSHPKFKAEAAGVQWTMEEMEEWAKNHGDSMWVTPASPFL